MVMQKHAAVVEVNLDLIPLQLQIYLQIHPNF